ncbi:MAG: glycosyltransferase [bacterium]|nr:glycosyltransferase [bacterium]
MDKIVIVMPAYNEAENMGLMIPELFDKEFPEISRAEMHLLIVDDYSPDKTGDVVKKQMGKYKNLHLLQGERKGLGWAYVRGFRYAMDKLHADAVMEMDADFQHPPRFVKPMVDAYLDGADYVIGSRYIKGGSVPGQWEFFRKFVSYFGNLFIRLVLLKPKLHDLTTGFRLTKVKGVLDQIDLEHLRELERFSHKVDLFYQSVKKAKKVVEVPLQFAARTKEISKFNPKETISTFRLAIILGIKDKERFVKFGLVGFLGFVINLVFIRIFRGLGLGEFLVWLLATEAAIINNYVLNNIWTFREAKIAGLKATTNKFLQFNLTSAGALVIQSIFGPLGVKLFGVRYDALILAFVVVFMVLPYNYFMYNAVIWKTWKLPWAKKKS